MKTTKGVSSSGPRPGRVASVALALALLAAPGAQAASQDLTISQPWIRFLTPAIPAAGYFTLKNAGAQAVELTGAESPACGTLMLHESVVESGTAHMRMVKSIVVPAHGSVSFRPGGYHLMCMKPSAKMAPGGHIPVSLRFQDGTTLLATFPVYGAKGK